MRRNSNIPRDDAPNTIQSLINQQNEAIRVLILVAHDPPRKKKSH
jgi:hypothetical protein